MITDGNHHDNCAVCGLPLEYYSYESYMGDCDLADCEECDTHYCEGYLVGPGGGDVDVPKAQLAYLKQVAEREVKDDVTRKCEAFIKGQLA